MRLALYNFSIAGHLFIELLLEALHERVHHDISVGFHLQGALEFRILSPKLFCLLGALKLSLANHMVLLLN